jgi:hypothetical protein
MFGSDAAFGRLFLTNSYCAEVALYGIFVESTMK